MAKTAAGPKGDRGWRWFVAEYAVVFVGVLTALVAQQAAESLNWRQKVAAARDAIRLEVADSAYAAEERVALRPCLEHRLDFLQARLAATGPAWTGQPWSRLDGHSLGAGGAYMAPLRDHNSEVWRALVADGTAAHFPRDEMLQLSSIYRYIDTMRDENVHEHQQIGRVSALGLSMPLPAEARVAAIMAVEDQRRINRYAAIGAQQLRDQIVQAGMLPAPEVWAQRMAGLRRYVGNCEAGRPTRSTPEGYPAADG
jgi:hypothetical protein